MKKLFFASLLSAIAFNSYSGANESSIKFLNTKPANKALPFSEAVKVSNTVYLSGQIGFNAQSGKLVSGGIKAEANQVMKNIKTSLNKYGYNMNDVVKCL